MGPNYPRLLVEPTGLRAWAQVTQGSWSRPRLSDPSARHSGVLFETAGLWLLARVTRDSWSTTRTIATDHKLPGRAG